MEGNTFFPETQAPSTPVAATAVWSDPALVTLWYVLFFVALAIIVLYVVRYFFFLKGRVPSEFEKIILLVTLPKESLQQEKGKAEDTQQEQIEEIALGETLINSIGGLKAEKGWKAWLYGRQDHLAFEIVADQGTISFYIATPQYLRRYIEQQVHAHYPEAHIEETEDYNIFAPDGVAKAGYLKFRRPSYFPIKTYKEMDDDPIESLANTLSQLEDNEGAVVQYVIRSAHPSWHRRGGKVASEMKQGKRLKEAQRAASQNIFVKGLHIIAEGFSGKKKDELGKTYQLSQMEEEMAKRIEEKSSKAGVEVNIRVVVSTDQDSKATIYLNNILNAFAQYNIYEYGNGFTAVVPARTNHIIEEYIHRAFHAGQQLILNTEEMASLWHLPTTEVDTPNIRWLTSKKSPAPLNVPKEGLMLGLNNYRGKETPIYMQRDDRRRHTYIIGKSGVGKSVLMANMARQDIANGDGVCVIDPHGDLVDDVLAGVPKERADDVIVFDPADVERPMGLNLLEFDPNYPEQKTFVINEMIRIFDKLYDLKSTGGPMFEQYIRNAMLLLMDDPDSGSTLMEISKVLSDEEYRKYKLSKCKTQVVKDFWEKEAQKAGGEAALQNIVPYITSKLNTFISNDFMRPIIGQQKSAIQFRDVMDSQKILLVKLSKGRLGDLNTNLLGMMMVGKILMAALSRTDTSKEQRKDFYLYIDEFQNFTTDSIAVILSEARKYMLNLIIAHQYIGQLVVNNDATIRDAVFGNVGTIISFKIGVEDAEVLAKEFEPVFNAYDVMNIEKYTAYVKLLVNNESTKAFNMHTAPLPEGNTELAQKIAELSRLKHGRDRQQVEQNIMARSQKSVAPPPRPRRVDTKLPPRP